MGFLQSLRITKTATMSSAGGLSNFIDLEGYRIVALDISSGWDAANLMSFRVSMDGVSFLAFRDSSGAELAIASGKITSTSGQAFALDDQLSLALSAHRYLKFQAGPGTASATPSTSVTITAILRQF